MKNLKTSKTRFFSFIFSSYEGAGVTSAEQVQKTALDKRQKDQSLKVVINNL